MFSVLILLFSLANFTTVSYEGFSELYCVIGGRRNSAAGVEPSLGSIENCPAVLLSGLETQIASGLSQSTITRPDEFEKMVGDVELMLDEFNDVDGLAFVELMVTFVCNVDVTVLPIDVGRAVVAVTGGVGGIVVAGVAVVGGGGIGIVAVVIMDIVVGANVAAVVEAVVGAAVAAVVGCRIGAGTPCTITI